MADIVASSDRDALQLTFVAEFDSPPERVWQLWSDPRQLERWWGPPTFPAVFTELDLAPGGRAAYAMTSPEGEKFPGWWRITSVDAPTDLSLDDGFADENGEPVADGPVSHLTVLLESLEVGDDLGTRMTLTTTFDSPEQMDELVEMGMLDGMKLAMGQIEGILAG
ncbi:SRPBCC family protein [Frondihabitans cladoniiphilus]|uniref:SRPBCC domain-containing protein n=1 Tax=Frondihabitans cladoniiphilus TaxID=715785 RepID=A0ABP8VPK9_9MICO